MDNNTRGVDAIGYAWYGLEKTSGYDTGVAEEADGVVSLDAICSRSWTQLDQYLQWSGENGSHYVPLSHRKQIIDPESLLLLFRSTI